MIEVVYKMQMKTDDGLTMVDNHEFDFEVDHPNQLTRDHHRKICDFLLGLYFEEEEGNVFAYSFEELCCQIGNDQVDLTDILQAALKGRTSS